MTNYSERIDEIINSAYEGEVSWIHDQLDGTSVMDEAIERIEDEKAKTKQAITSLIKELVAGAKPEVPEEYERDDALSIGFTRGTEYYYDAISNLLKTLEKGIE